MPWHKAARWLCRCERLRRRLKASVAWWGLADAPAKGLRGRCEWLWCAKAAGQGAAKRRSRLLRKRWLVRPGAIGCC